MYAMNTDLGPEERERVKLLSPVVLAFVGDAVYTLLVRERLALGGGRPSELNRLAAERVSAEGQSKLLLRVLPLLTEEEEEIFRRGRNAKKQTKSKNAGAVDYARSTGFEALLGYLHLIGQDDRIEELVFAKEETP